MKRGISTDIDWSYIGATLAREDDNVQAAFFKAFVKECLSFGTHYQAESQLASINLKLTDNEKELLGMLGYMEGQNEI